MAPKDHKGFGFGMKNQCCEMTICCFEKAVDNLEQAQHVINLDRGQSG